MRRVIVLLFGVVSYAVFFTTFLYLIAFLGNLQLTPLADVIPLRDWVPFSVDAGREAGSVPLAIAINLGLILLFGLQHSVMARTGFKARLTRLLPKSAERSVYVLIASALLGLLFWQWRPIAEPSLWQLSGVAASVMWAIYAGGLGLVLLATFLIDHFDLFGLKQVWLQLIGRPHGDPVFRTPLLYKYVRHPLYLGWFLTFWATPSMTVGRLIFAAGMCSYILVAIVFEERDLVRAHGRRYELYQQDVPMLVPGFGRKQVAPEVSERG